VSYKSTLQGVSSRLDTDIYSRTTKGLLFLIDEYILLEYGKQKNQSSDNSELLHGHQHGVEDESSCFQQGQQETVW